MLKAVELFMCEGEVRIVLTAYTRSGLGRFLLFLLFSNKTADTFYLPTSYRSLLLLDVLAEPVEAFLEATLLEDRAHLQM